MRAPNHLNALRAFEAAARHLSYVAAAETSTIALDAGFGDVSYFNRSFRKRFGMTPSEWRHDQRFA